MAKEGKIIYHPIALEGLLASPFAQRRLKNRDGCCVIQDASGQIIDQLEDSVIKVYDYVKEVLNANSYCTAIILEHGYGCSGIPARIRDYLTFHKDQSAPVAMV